MVNVSLVIYLSHILFVYVHVLMSFSGLNQLIGVMHKECAPKHELSEGDENSLY